jgi:hypothetical protein
VENVSGGWAWRRRRSGSGAYNSWLDWQLLITSWVPDAYTRVTAVKRHGDGVQMVFMVTSTGAVKVMEEPFPVSQPGDFTAPATMVDIAAGLQADNRVIVIALDSAGYLWVRQQYGTSGGIFYGWYSAVIPKFVPDVGCPNENPTGIKSVMVSRWQDDPLSTVVPVIFITDNRGMIYYSAYETGPCTAVCDCGTKFQPWKPFYHAKRWADY